jgi:hypothetical protein
VACVLKDPLKLPLFLEHQGHRDAPLLPGFCKESVPLWKVRLPRGEFIQMDGTVQGTCGDNGIVHYSGLQTMQPIGERAYGFGNPGSRMMGS